MRSRKRQLWLRAGVAVASIGVSAVARMLLFSAIGGKFPYSVFYPAIAISAIVGGLLIGLLAITLACAVVLLITPAVAGQNPLVGADLRAFIMFLSVSAMLLWICERARRAKARAEQALKAQRESDCRLNGIFESISDPFYSLDRQWRYTYVNEACQRMGKMVREEVLGKVIWEVFPQVRGSVLEEQLRRAMQEQVPLHFEYFSERLNQWLAASAFPSAEGVAVYCRDISREKRVADALRGSEARFRQLADAMPQIVWTARPDGYIDYYNQRWYEYTGLSMGQSLAPEGWKPILHPDDVQRCMETWDAAVRSGEEYEIEYRFREHASGAYRWHLGRALPVRDEKGQIVRWFGTCTDIDDQKRVQDELRNSEGRLVLAINAAKMGTWDVDLLSGRVHESAEIGPMMGGPRQAFEVDAQTWMRHVHPDDLPGVLEKFTAATEGRGDYDVEYRIIGIDGKLRWVACRGMVQRDSTGRPLRVMGVAFEVTEVKEVQQERERLLLAEQQARREAETANQTKDHFLAVLSHELRTPLTPVLATVQLLERDPSLNEEMRESVTLIRRNVELEAKLIEDLLDLTKISRGKLDLQLTHVDLHEKLRHVLQICQPDIEAKELVLRLDLGADKRMVHADAARLQQVLWNLLKNAVKFTPPGGRILVRSQNDGDETVMIQVKDTGIGIDAEALPRIFDAFEQGHIGITKQFGGMGLGLAISKALVELHHGLLTAHSDGKNTGAEFTLRLPISAVVEQAVPEEIPPEKAPDDQGHTILLVEDHPDTSRVLARLLRRMGYQVRTADSVAAAVDQGRYQFDLLISDIGLPDGTGHDVIRQLSAVQRVRGLAVSGYGMEDDVRRCREAGFREHLTKPINVQQLEAVVRRMLQEKPTPDEQRQGIEMQG
ncbi:MAG TPA: PAS domain-containing protein [Tepidisphaeraceae bacterium]